MPKARQKKITPRVFVPGLDNCKLVGLPVGDTLCDVGGVVRPLHLLVAGDGRLQGRLEYIVRDEVATEVEEVVDQLNPPLRCRSFAQHRLHLGAARVDCHCEGKTHQGGEEGGGEEIDDRPHCHLPVELGVEASCPRDEAGNDQRQDHELEQTHEELPWVG